MNILNNTKIKLSKKKKYTLLNFIFISRWLQLPLYIGLIISQFIYVYHFLVELFDFVGSSFGNINSLRHIAYLISTSDKILKFDYLNEQTIILIILTLIDFVMISNLLVMIIIGGYETFFLNIKSNNCLNKSNWFSNINNSILKVKLSTAIISVSSIHLLKTFINASICDIKILISQVFIHLTFLLSAITISYCNKLSNYYSIKINNK